MFADLDATLQALLTSNGAPPLLRSAVIAFDPPDKDYKPVQASVNCFLYDVGENRILRDPTHHLTLGGDGYGSISPAMRVDCTYLVTAWSTKTGALRTADEHQLLATALAWLARFPVIDATMLVGALSNPPQRYPVTSAVAQTREGENLGQFWSALGIAPRASFSLTVTVAVQPFDEVETFPEVKELQLAIEPLDRVLTGQVLEPALVAVAAARVLEVASGGQTVTDDSGWFSFPDLEFGERLLRVTAEGHPDFESAVQYSIDSQTHNLVLPSP